MSKPPIDELDRQIILATQEGLPLTTTPYFDIAQKLEVEENEILTRMQKMQEQGIIRRISVVPNHYAMGYKANGMSVWDVPDEQIDQLGQQLGQLPFISHCYHRPRHLPEWPYNLFAMIHAHDRETVEQRVAQVAEILGDSNRGHQVLYSKRILKKTGLRLPVERK